jgi:hypothetical protein
MNQLKQQQKKAKELQKAIIIQTIKFKHLMKF